MEHKGYLQPDGRVTQTASGEDIGELFYKETRYSLRRLIVVRTWIAKPLSADGKLIVGARFEGNTRREAIAALREWRAARPVVVLHHDQHGAEFFCDDETAVPLVGTLVDAADRITHNYTLEDKTGWEVGQ